MTGVQTCALPIYNESFIAEFSAASGTEVLVWQTMTALPFDVPLLIQAGIVAGSITDAAANESRVQGRLIAVDPSGGMVAALSAWVPLGYLINSGGAYFSKDPPMSGAGTNSYGRQGVATRRRTFDTATYGTYGTVYAAWQVKIITSLAGSRTIYVDGIGNLTYVTIMTGCGACDPVEPEEPE